MLTFTTPGSLDPRAFSTFGLSSKTDSDKIGRFGTGLKYAISLVLNAGGQFHISTKNEVLTFTAKAIDFRGTESHVVHVNGEPLPFTTHLGSSWELWMAYRELYSNTLDEGGSVDFTSDETPPQPTGTDQTIISISLPSLYVVHFEKDLYFIDQDETPLHTDSLVEIYPGKTKSLYYKNIAVYTLPGDESYSYRYNLLTYNELTEDRTLKHASNGEYDIAHMLARCSNETVLKTCLDIHKSPVESAFEYRDWWDMSAAFSGVVDKLDIKCGAGATFFAMRKKMLDASQATIYGEGETPASIQTALAHLRALGVDLSEIRLAVAPAGAMRADWERKVGVIFLNPKIIPDTQRTLYAVMSAVLRDLGESWVIAKLLSQSTAIINAGGKK